MKISRKITLSIIVLLLLVIVVFSVLVSLNVEGIGTIRDAILKSGESDLVITKTVYRKSTDLTKAMTLVSVNSSVGLEYIIYPDGNKIFCSGRKSMCFDFTFDDRVEYTFKIKEKNKAEIEETLVVQSKEITINFLDKYDEYIYLSESYGNDSTGDGSIAKPYKTLSKLVSSGRIQANKKYGVYLDSGSYTVNEDLFTMTTCNGCTINLIGNREKTKLLISHYGSGSTGHGGNENYTINYYRLVWDGTNDQNGNKICIDNPMNFYAVAFTNLSNLSDYFVYGTKNFWNCIQTSHVDDLFYLNGHYCKVYNSYGCFTSGFKTYDTDWIDASDYINENPQYDSNTYRITESESLWVGKGIGYNPDETKANLGVYGGEYSWDYNSDISNTYESAIKYVSSITLNKTSTYIYKGNTEQLSANVLPTTAENKTLSWKSSNQAVATVDINGLVTAVDVGTATITAESTDREFNNVESNQCVVNVTNNRPYAVADEVRVGTEPFFVFKASGAQSDNVTLVSKYYLDENTMKQSESAGKIVFSSSMYWRPYVSSYPADINDIPSSDSNDLINKVKAYATSLGADKGRLPTIGEIDTLISGKPYGYMNLNTYPFWTSTATYVYGNKELYAYPIRRANGGNSTASLYYQAEMCKPVIEISKDLVTPAT